MTKILLVSTWPPQQCGVADYTYNLAHALRGDTQIAAEWDREAFTRTSNRRHPETMAVHRGWQRRGRFNPILQLVNELKPNVVHIQHEFGLFPDHRSWAALLDALEKTQTRVVITLHTVLLPPQRTEFFADLTARKNVRVIVHTAEGAATLQRHAHVIPHGVSAVTNVPRSISRTWLNLPSTLRSLGLCPGFLSPGKGHQEIIEAFARVSRQDDRLAIVGLCRNTNYQIQLEQAIDYFGVASRVILDPTYQEANQRAMWFNAADYVILGAKSYKDLSTAPRSASGQLATAISYGRPIVAKNVPIYRDPHVDLLYDDVASCAAYMSAKMTAKPQTFTARDLRTWADVAKQHKKVYTQ